MNLLKDNIFFEDGNSFRLIGYSLNCNCKYFTVRFDHTVNSLIGLYLIKSSESSSQPKKKYWKIRELLNFKKADN